MQSHALAGSDRPLQARICVLECAAMPRWQGPLHLYRAMFRLRLLSRRCNLGALSIVVLALLSGFASPSASAMDMGRPQTLSGLGEPLSLMIPLTLAPGERLAPECVSVALEAAGQPVDGQIIQRVVERGAEPGMYQVWVRTTQPITEPVLKLTVGCPRQSVAVLVDPTAAVAKSEIKGQVVMGRTVPADVSAGLDATRALSAVGPSVQDLSPQTLALADGDGRGLRLHLALGPAGERGSLGARKSMRWTKSSQSTVLTWSFGLGSQDEMAARVVAGAASRAGLVQQVESQLQHLRAEQLALNQEIQQLMTEAQAREASQQRQWGQLWAIGGALLLVGLGLGLWWRRRRA